MEFEKQSVQSKGQIKLTDHEEAEDPNKPTQNNQDGLKEEEESPAIIPMNSVIGQAINELVEREEEKASQLEEHTEEALLQQERANEQKDEEAAVKSVKESQIEEEMEKIVAESAKES